MLELGGGWWIEPWWIEPTVPMRVDHSMRIMKEETFGPIMPAMGYSTVDEAPTLAFAFGPVGPQGGEQAAAAAASGAVVVAAATEAVAAAVAATVN